MTATAPDPSAFGDAWAPVYDRLHPELAADAVAATTALLALTRPGDRVVDLGVGTGRLAIPLAAAGREVVGVDASPRMLQAVADKPGGDRVRGVLADIAGPDVGALGLDGTAALVVLAFNTLFALLTQDAQCRCLAAAARLLAPGGHVVVDAAIPRPWLLDGEHDPLAQTVHAQHRPAGMSPLPLAMRYAHPPEIDLMARVAGLELVRRSADWAGAPVGPGSDRHVSTYALVARPDDPIPPTRGAAPWT